MSSFNSKIVLIGDSVPFGWNLNYKDSIAGHLESLNDEFQIVNASVPIIIEIKGNYSPYIENRIYEIIRSYTGKVAIKSFNIAYIQWICEFLPFLTKLMHFLLQVLILLNILNHFQDLFLLFLGFALI